MRKNLWNDYRERIPKSLYKIRVLTKVESLHRVETKIGFTKQNKRLKDVLNHFHFRKKKLVMQILFSLYKKAEDKLYWIKLYTI